jgi:hypothetical protein
MCRETLTIIAEIATIIGNVLLVWLTVRMIILIRKDKEKKLSLIELQEQTRTLADSFKLLIRPNLFVNDITTRQYSTEYFEFKYQNTGSSCYNLEIAGHNLPELSKVDIIHNTNIASGTIDNGFISNTNHFVESNTYFIDITFNDAEGTKYKQTLNLSFFPERHKQIVIFSSPELIS